VRDAYRLWHDALSVAAADEEGRLDMNLLTGGTSGAQRQFMEHVLPDLLRSLLNGEKRYLAQHGVVQHTESRAGW
jgi:hypothetical protein